MKSRGFTLVELVMVIAITGIIAASIAIFFKPAIDGYFDMRRRAELADMADTALRRIGRDVRRAVPNSIRIPNSQCFELVPTISGGLYRRGVDIVNTGSDPLDTTAPDASFDVLSPLSAAPAAGDFVVIGNQNGNDVYAGGTRGTVGPPLSASRITLTAATQFPAGYDGGRFQVVSAAEQSVFYICDGAGNLMRLVRPFTAVIPTACPPTADAVPLATSVAACEFIYNPNQGATQQSGFVWMHIELLSAGERVALNYGVHVSNVP